MQTTRHAPSRARERFSRYLGGVPGFGGPLFPPPPAEEGGGGGDDQFLIGRWTTDDVGAHPLRSLPDSLMSIGLPRAWLPGLAGIWSFYYCPDGSFPEAFGVTPGNVVAVSPAIETPSQTCVFPVVLPFRGAKAEWSTGGDARAKWDAMMAANGWVAVGS